MRDQVGSRGIFVTHMNVRDKIVMAGVAVPEVAVLGGHFDVLDGVVALLDAAGDDDARVLDLSEADAVRAATGLGHGGRLSRLGLVSEGEERGHVGDKGSSEGLDGAPGVAVHLAGAVLVDWEASDGDGDEEEADGEQADQGEAPGDDKQDELGCET